MEKIFIGYHCSNFEIEPDGYQGSVEDYKEYLKDIIENLPPIQKEKIKREVNDYNKSSYVYEKQPINLSNLPRNFDEVELYDEDVLDELCQIVDGVIGGVIFVDTESAATEYGTNCYKAYMNGNNFIALPDKAGSMGTEKMYVYFGTTNPVLEKEIKHSLVSEDYKTKLQTLAGIKKSKP